MVQEKRWAILEHSGAPDDPLGLHFDLLVEETTNCRTWRLEQIPVIDGPGLHARTLKAHNLTWLEITEKKVSGGRGIAKRVFHGLYRGFLPRERSDLMIIQLEGSSIDGLLEINQEICFLRSIEQQSTTRLSKHP